MTTSANPESINLKPLSVMLLGLPEWRRGLSSILGSMQAQVKHEDTLPDREKLLSLLEEPCDVLIVDLDANTEHGLDVVETACGAGRVPTVMVHSRQADPDLLMRCMRAGAREFLTDLLSPSSITEALIRAGARRQEIADSRKTAGKCFVFAGAKGGSGVTTIAANFAVALAEESKQTVGFLDLNIRLGDAAVSLGIRPEFSTLDALANESRMDSDLVQKLLVRHSSGLQVLAAPEEEVSFSPNPSAVMKLIHILRLDFSYLVVDVGTHYQGFGDNLFASADRVFLVTQVSVPDLRNSRRFLEAHSTGDRPHRVEVVLNRYTPRPGEIDQESVEKALTLPAKWRIPSDYQAIRNAQNSASALVLRDGPISRAISAMAKDAAGKTEEPKKKRFGLF